MTAFDLRNRFGLKTLACLCTAFALFGCAGNDSPLGADDTDTDDGDASASSASTTADGPAATASTTASSTTGNPDPSEGGDTDDGGDGTSGGEIEGPSPYRIVFTSADGGTTRLYGSSDDFSDVEPLTAPGPVSVTTESWWARPRLHSDRRHLFYMRGSDAWVLDVFSEEAHLLPFDGAQLLQRDWSPADLEMSVLDTQGRLLRVAADGSDSVTLVYSFAGDGDPLEDIDVSYSPLGDRFAVRSRPNGVDRILWMVDAEGEQTDPVFEPASEGPILWGWTASGEDVYWIADASNEILGDELAIGSPDGFSFLSEGHENVRGRPAYAADGSRFAFVSNSGVVSVQPDGSEQFTVGPLVDGGNFDLQMSDDGSFYALEQDGSLIVGAANIYNFVELHDFGVDNPTFEPGGVRLAYVRHDEENGPQRLYMVDGNGSQEVSTSLQDGETVVSFRWFAGGLIYVVGNEDGPTSLLHTDAGDDPLFVAEPDELFEAFNYAVDQQRAVVRTTSDGINGRMCSLDTADMTNVQELGCTNFTVAENTVHTFTIARDVDVE